MLHLGLTILSSIMWLLILSLTSLGWGRLLIHKKDITKKTLNSAFDIELSVGISFLSLLITWLLFFKIYSFQITLLIIFTGSTIGLITTFRTRINLYLKLKNWDIRDKVFLTLILLILSSHFFRMLTPSGSQESFQYHYYLPKLFTEQNTLNLVNLELYEALLNVWGYEVLLSLSFWFGGLPFIILNVFFLFCVFILQVYFSVLRIFKDRSIALISILMIQFSAVYVYFMWWSKPELVVTGMFLLIFSLFHSKKIQTTPVIAIASITVFMFSVKMTSVVLIPLIFILCFFHKVNFNFIAKVFLNSLIISIPWAIYLIYHKGASGALPTINPEYFDAPINNLNHDDSKHNTISRYIENLIGYNLLFKPGIYFFLCGIPLFIYDWRKYLFLIAGVLFNYLLAILILFKSMMYYSDEFRYFCFTLVCIPIGAAVFFKHIIRWKILLVLSIVLFSYLAIKRSHVSINEGWRYYSGYLLGEKKLDQVLTREGGDHFNYYNEHKNTHKKNILLHIGHGNIVVDGNDVIHVGSWSKKYPIWKYKSKTELLNWLKSKNVTWVLLEKMRYETYSRGIGGPEYTDSPLTLYYIEVLEVMKHLEPFTIQGLPFNYKLYKLPD